MTPQSGKVDWGEQRAAEGSRVVDQQHQQQQQQQEGRGMHRDHTYTKALENSKNPAKTPRAITIEWNVKEPKETVRIPQVNWVFGKWNVAGETFESYAFA